MKWYETKSVEELKELGNLKTVKMEINRDLKKITGRSKLTGFLEMGSNSWKGQYEKIQALKKVMNIFTDEKGQAIGNSLDSGYFKSEADRYIFCLLELSGEERMRQLKIYKSLYINKDAAKEWYHNIAKNIHPDTCSAEQAAAAMAELSSIYNKMVKHE